MPSREEAIEDFLRSHDLEEKLGHALSAVASRNPAAILIFWEDDEGYGALTVPHSRALAYGLVQKAYEMLVEEDTDVDDDDSAGDEPVE